MYDVGCRIKKPNWPHVCPCLAIPSRTPDWLRVGGVLAATWKPWQIALMSDTWTLLFVIQINKLASTIKQINGVAEGLGGLAAGNPSITIQADVGGLGLRGRRERVFLHTYTWPCLEAHHLGLGGLPPRSLSITPGGVALLAIISAVRSRAAPLPRHISLCQLTPAPADGAAEREAACYRYHYFWWHVAVLARDSIT